MHLGRAPLFPKPGKRFGRRGQFCSVLHPVCDRCLITPGKQARHYAQVRSGGAKRTHGRLVAPDRDSPRSPLGVARKIPTKKAIGTPHLPGREIRVKQKLWQVSQRPQV